MTPLELTDVPTSVSLSALPLPSMPPENVAPSSVTPDTSYSVLRLTWAVVVFATVAVTMFDAGLIAEALTALTR